MRYWLLWLLALLFGCGGDTASIVGADPPASPTPPHLEISPVALVIGPGADTTLEVAAYASGGRRVAAPILTWSTSAPTVASVSQEGVVTGVNGGVATISAWWSGLKATIAVVVTQPILEAQLRGGWGTLLIGTRAAVAGWTRDSSYSYLGPPDSWFSSDTTVATVAAVEGDSTRAIVTGIGQGVTTITAVAGRLKAGVSITVLEPLPYGIGGLEVLEARMLEYQYSGHDDWLYAPIIRVRSEESAVDLLSISVTVPGSGAREWCGPNRFLPFQTVDLNHVSADDYYDGAIIGFDKPSRLPPDSNIEATLLYRRGDGAMVTYAFALPIGGVLPTRETGVMEADWSSPCGP